MKKMNLTLGLALALAPMALMADEAKPAAAAPAAKPAAEAKVEAKADAKAADAGNTAEAKAAATPVAKNDAPGSITPGNKLIDEGKFDEAVAYFEGIGEQTTANGAKKREPWRLVGLSSAYIGVGKFDKAEEAAQKAIAIDGPHLSAAWNNLGSAQAQSGKREDAVATYEKAIETLKAAGKDTAKLEANLAPIKAALEEAKAKADKKAGRVPAAVSGTAKAEAPKAEAPKAAAPAAVSGAAK
jgi:tetratricopeptide (TPR) repeat protein